MKKINNGNPVTNGDGLAERFRLYAEAPDDSLRAAFGNAMIDTDSFGTVSWKRGEAQQLVRIASENGRTPRFAWDTDHTVTREEIDWLDDVRTAAGGSVVGPDAASYLREHIEIMRALPEVKIAPDIALSFPPPHAFSSVAVNRMAISWATGEAPSAGPLVHDQAGDMYELTVNLDEATIPVSVNRRSTPPQVAEGIRTALSPYGYEVDIAHTTRDGDVIIMVLPGGTVPSIPSLER